MTVLRDGQEQKIDVTLGNLKDLDETSRRTRSPTISRGREARLARRSRPDGGEESPTATGVVVTSIAEDSPAADKGIQEGDVIMAVGGKAGVHRRPSSSSGMSAAQAAGPQCRALQGAGRERHALRRVPFERG